jgi:hypothetical protein
VSTQQASQQVLAFLCMLDVCVHICHLTWGLLSPCVDIRGLLSTRAWVWRMVRSCVTIAPNSLL